MSLRMDNVGFRYRGAEHAALTGIDLEFIAGAVTAIVGPNAAGKSTLLRIAAALARPTTGTVWIENRHLRRLSASERAARIAYMAQRPSLGAGFTVRQTLALGRYALGANSGAIDRALDRVGVSDLADRGFHTLSAGQQQRVALARALAQLDPWGSRTPPPGEVFLFLDEPTSSMDARHAIDTLLMFRQLADIGIGVVAAMHDLTWSARIADYAVALRAGGELAATGSAAETLTTGVLEPIYSVPFVRTETPEGDILTPAMRQQERLS